jgi:hypothetical protein
MRYAVGFIFVKASSFTSPIVWGVRGTCSETKSARSKTSSALSARSTFIERILSSET